MFVPIFVSIRQNSWRKIAQTIKQLSQRDEELSAQIRQLQAEIAPLKRPAA
jgi:hypothetical protein